MRKVADQYTVSVPGDAAETMAGILDLAIQEARERARLHVIPCEWHAAPLNGSVGDHQVLVSVVRVRSAETVRRRKIHWRLRELPGCKA